MVATSREGGSRVRDRLPVARASFMLSGAAVVALVLALVVNFAFCYLSLGLSVLAFAAIARAHMRLRGEGPRPSEPSISDDALDVLDVPEPAPVSEREARPRRRPFFP